MPKKKKYVQLNKDFKINKGQLDCAKQQQRQVVYTEKVHFQSMTYQNRAFTVKG
jgi:hypothetical protein